MGLVSFFEDDDDKRRRPLPRRPTTAIAPMQAAFTARDMLGNETTGVTQAPAPVPTIWGRLAVTLPAWLRAAFAPAAGGVTD